MGYEVEFKVNNDCGGSYRNDCGVNNIFGGRSIRFKYKDDSTNIVFSTHSIDNIKYTCCYENQSFYNI